MTQRSTSPQDIKRDEHEPKRELKPDMQPFVPVPNNTTNTQTSYTYTAATSLAQTSTFPNGSAKMKEGLRTKDAHTLTVK